MDKQSRDVLRLLRQHKKAGITALEAMISLNCYRLAARIYDLRAAGYTIETTREAHDGGSHARYYLRAQPTSLGPV